jgi:hypothetical protein
MRDDRIYLEHIRDCLARIGAYTAAGRARFLAEMLARRIGRAGVIEYYGTLCAATMPDASGHTSAPSDTEHVLWSLAIPMLRAEETRQHELE